MTSLLSGLMKISGKLPLASTADAMLPSPGRAAGGGREGGREAGARGREGEGGCRPRANEKFYENFRD